MPNGSSLQPDREDLFVPDRFEGLRQAGAGALKSIIVPVGSMLEIIDERFVEMRVSRRGGFMILEGTTGAGKSTFLDTVGLFRRDVVTLRIGTDEDVSKALETIEGADAPRVIVLEGREALGEASEQQIEAALHGVNSILRSDRGLDSLVVWPSNRSDLSELLLSIATAIGAEALLGTTVETTEFSGPSEDQYVGIAERTVAALNQGASLAALGISEERAKELASQATTIGKYLALVRDELTRNSSKVRQLLSAEQFRVWTVVVAGNDTEGDVAALTRGGFALADVDRLMTATGANIVKDLRKQPDSVGILGTVLDARILNLDVLTVLAVAREYGSARLHEEMEALGMSTSRDSSAAERIRSSDLGLVMGGDPLATRKRGKKPGSSTSSAFNSLAKIARSDDSLLNDAIGRALADVGLIEQFEVERDLGTELRFVSDLYAIRGGEPVRIEIMWRTKTGRAAIANYVLGKLGNYGRAVGLLD